MVGFLGFSKQRKLINNFFMKGGVANWYFVLARTSTDPKAPAGKVNIEYNNFLYTESCSFSITFCYTIK